MEACTQSAVCLQVLLPQFYSVVMAVTLVLLSVEMHLGGKEATAMCVLDESLLPEYYYYSCVTNRMYMHWCAGHCVTEINIWSAKTPVLAK